MKLRVRSQLVVSRSRESTLRSSFCCAPLPMVASADDKRESAMRAVLTMMFLLFAAAGGWRRTRRLRWNWLRRTSMARSMRSRPPAIRGSSSSSRSGTIRIMEDGAVLPDPFLDISGSVSCCGEQGLLGLAFHPDYAANGRFFVNFTNELGQHPGHRVPRFGRSQCRRSAAGARPPEGCPALRQPQRRLDRLRARWAALRRHGRWRRRRRSAWQRPEHARRARQDPADRCRQRRGRDLRLRASAIRGATPSTATCSTSPMSGRAMWEEIDVLGIGDAGANLGWNIMEGAVCYRQPQLRPSRADAADPRL